MCLRFLGKGGSGKDDCPALYATDDGSYLIIGWQTGYVGTIEIPHLLLGFVESRTFIGSPMTDTGRGTFTLSGRAVTAPETLAQLKMEDYEEAILVPKAERTYFGGVPADSRGLATLSR
ncbi:hypothetical protein [Nocardia transvalensis]|uniref:hypothetical protein n=1 Tax=Nocardia transvalensis TaxID=37333 RepID=UPI0018955435|nr:hypothetical protein [Nocardia transvalensis]MBF6330934.1 hypothetical protein [Nocardia transvalensis]